jgi:DNA-directed RNA polymerase specialized sigma24 family protein
MTQLAPGLRKAIALRELNELSAVETARVLGLPVQAMKARMFHEWNELRETLKRIVESTWMSRKRYCSVEL